MQLPELLLYVLCAVLLVLGIARIRHERRHRERERMARRYQDLARRHAALVRDGRQF